MSDVGRRISKGIGIESNRIEWCVPQHISNPRKGPQLSYYGKMEHQSKTKQVDALLGIVYPFILQFWGQCASIAAGGAPLLGSNFFALSM